MAVTITPLLTTLEDCEASPSGWSTITWTQYAGFQREGTYCYGEQVSNTTVTGYKTVTAFNMSAAAIYVWIFAAGQMDTTANGGIGIVLGDGSHRRAYYVGGSDQSKFQIGAWNCFMVDATNPPTQYNQETGTTAPNFSAITQVGVRFKTLSKSLGGADNCFIDVMRWGTGLLVEGGTSGSPGTFAEIAADDASTASGKAYGIVRAVQPGVYEVQGELQFGDNGTGSSHFEDEDAVVVYSAGAGDSLYKFSLIGNTTGTNVFKLGEKVGTGDTAQGRNGCTILSAGPKVSVDLDDTNMDTVQVYGSQFSTELGSVVLPTDTTAEIIGTTFSGCGQVIANQCIIRNCVFSGFTLDTLSALLWNSTINIKNCSFVANTDSINDPHAIEHPASGTFSYYGLLFSGNDYDINFSAASGTLTINAADGSNPATYEITSGGTSVTINNAVNVTVHTVDPDGNDLSGVRVLIETTPGGTDIISGVTDVNGDISSTWNYAGDQAIIGRARKASTFPFYKAFDFVGTITSNGYSITIRMVEDE